MFCEKCGAAMSANQTVCPTCGAPANAPTNAPAASTSKLYDLLTLIGIVLLALGNFLPFYTVSMFGMSESVSFIEGDGVFVLIFAVLAFILYAMNKDKLMVISSVLSVIILLIDSSELSKIGVGSYGIGYFAIWIGLILIAVLPFTPLAKTKSLFIKK